VLGVVSLALVTGAAAAALGYSTNKHPYQGITALASPPGVTQPVSDPLASPVVDNSGNLTSAAQRVVPGLVDVNTELGMQGAAGAGTGIVLTSDGEVLTNNHVVEGATNISVTDVGNGRTYRANVVGYDRSQDVAVLRLVGAAGLTVAPLGNSSSVAVGDSIAGVGNAGGVGGAPSMAAGQVAALNQSITASDEGTGSSEQLTGLIQVAADIQPGDSGGPLINGAGDVVGMDTAASANYKFGRQVSAGRAGAQGFAIPINQALSIAKNIESSTASNTVHIGPTAFIGVTVSDANGSGAVIRQLVPNGPAEQAGLAPGDVITTVDGHRIDSATTLTHTLDGYHPNDTITFGWVDQQMQQQHGQISLAQGPVG
jgi:S1-C subfamily serine protease